MEIKQASDNAHYRNHNMELSFIVDMLIQLNTVEWEILTMLKFGG